MKKVLAVASECITAACVASGTMVYLIAYKPNAAMAAIDVASNSTTDGSGMAILLVMIGVALIFYFLPTIIASSRDVPFTFAIFFINLVLGWTLIIWIVLLIWSVAAVSRAQDEFYKRSRGK